MSQKTKGNIKKRNNIENWKLVGTKFDDDV